MCGTGCDDSNALRQARAAGDELIVGIHSDAEILRNKGALPLVPEAERLAALRACKFVDVVLQCVSPCCVCVLCVVNEDLCLCACV